MLSSLFGSEIRAKIFKLFFSDPEKSFVLDEAAKLLIIKPLALEKELEALVKEGFLLSESKEIEIVFEEDKAPVKTKAKTKGDIKIKTKPKAKAKAREIKIYQADSKNIFFPDIRSVISKEKILSIKDGFNSIRDDFHPRLMFLSGKFVDSPELPTDVFVVGNVPRRHLLSAISDLEKVLGYEINFTLMNEKEFDYRREVMDVFLYNVLEGRKIILAGEIELIENGF